MTGECAIGRYRSVLPTYFTKGVKSHLADHLPADVGREAGTAEVVTVYPVHAAAGSHRHPLRAEVVVAGVGDATAGAPAPRDRARIDISTSY